MAAVHRMSGVTAASIVAMMQWLKSEYDDFSNDNKLQTQIVTSPGNLRQAEIRRSATSDPLAYPFALFSLGEIALHTERGGLQDRSGTRGVQTNRNLQDGYAEFETMRPTILTYGINFRTAAYNDVWAFSHALLLAAPKKRLVIESDEGFRVECSVVIDPSLTVPPLDSVGEAGSIYSFDTTLRLETFIGIATRHRLIRRISIKVLESNGPRTLIDSDTKTVLDGVNFNVDDFFDPASGLGRYNLEKPR